MKGNIYTDEKCIICKGRLFHDENRSVFYCKDHPEHTIYPRKCAVKFGRDVFKRFKSYKEAAQFLAGLRYKTVEGTFDARDYKKDNPLGFETQASKYLVIKEQNVEPGSFKNIKSDIGKAIKEWGQKNVKTIKYGDIEDFLFCLPVSDKTRANTKSTLHDFFVWLNNREDIPIPKFPKCDFELGWRNIIDIDTQQSIIEEVKRISYHINPKIWIGIKWLSTFM